MTSKPNNDDASTVTGSNARFSLAGLLLLSVGLLLSIFQPAFAAPGTGKPAGTGRSAFTTYSLGRVKDHSVSPSGLDMVQITATPAVPGNVTLYYSLDGSPSLSSVTVTDGIGYISFSHNIPAVVAVTIYDDPGGTDQVGVINMTFIAAPLAPDITASYFTVVTNDAASNGVATDIVTAYLFDVYGNPVGTSYNSTNPPTVDWTVPASANPTSSPNTTISSGGTSTLSMNDLTAQTVNVTAIASYTDPVSGITTTFPLQDQSTPRLSYLPVTFIQPVPNVNTSYIVALVTPNPANNGAQDEVEAMVYDQSGALYNGPITFTIETGTATLVTASTNVVNGVATAFYKSGTPGQVQIQAQVVVSGVPTFLHDQANTANNYVTIVFYNPPPDLTLSYITPLITPMPADGSKDEVQVYLVGTNGLPLQGVNVTITVAGAATVVTGQPVTTDNNGLATAFITSTTPGYYDVTATYTDPNTGITYTLNDKVNTSQPYSIVQFTVPPPITTPPPGNSYSNPPYYITVIGTATADGSDTAVVQLHITDGTYNEPDGYKVQFVVTSNTPASPTAIMTGSDGTKVTGTLTTTLGTNANGSIDIPITDLVAGSVTIQAFAWDPATNAYDISYGTQTVIFTAGQAVPGQPGGGGSGGTNPGNGGQGPGSGGSGSSGGGGGDGDNSGPGDNSNFTVLFVREPFDYQLANGVAQDSLIAYVSDKNKNAVPGVPVTFFFQTSPTSGSATSTAQFVGSLTVNTDDSGMARIAVTNTLPGTVFVNATIVDPASGNTVLIDGSYQIAHFVTKPDVTNIQTALTVIIGEALADGIQQNEVKAHVVDLDGNVMPNQPVYFAIDSGTGTIVTPQPVMTDANGDAYIQITSKTTGYVLITATVDNEKIFFGSPARVYFAQINIYVPRVFTPNNDGTNDLLKPILVGITTFHYFNVYNRWGNLVYTSQDPNQGWDGTFKGVPQPVETYLWIAEGIDENGRKVVQKGMTSLVR